MLTFYRDERRDNAIQGNVRVKAVGTLLLIFFFVFSSLLRTTTTGQAPVLFRMPEPIDEATPKEACTCTGSDGNEYELIFSDEFEVDGRTFWPGEFLSLRFCWFLSFSYDFPTTTVYKDTTCLMTTTMTRTSLLF